MEGGDPATALTELATDVLPRVEALQTYVWRRHLAGAAQHLLQDTSTLKIIVSVGTANMSMSVLMNGRGPTLAGISI